MKQNIILAIILVILLSIIFSIDGNGQRTLQVKIVSVTFEGKNKCLITGVSMQGDSVFLKYGFTGGYYKNRYLKFVPGLWLSVREMKGKKKEGYCRSKIIVNQ